jgi:dTDP-4-amino-4,6-dideoxygalactose transaminase
MTIQQIPVMKPKLPTHQQTKKYIKQIEKTRTYSNYGPLVEELENRFANFLGVDKDLVVLCANATLALQGAAYLMPVRKFKAPAYTFPASLTSVLNTGKEIELVDIFLDDWKIDAGLENENTGLVEVLPFGAPLRMQDNENWNYKIIDAAASIGAGEHSFERMDKNWVTIFSLHATKIMGIGEGGIAVFASKNFAGEFRSWINFGFSGSRNSKLLGINAKMSEYSAAYGHAVLDGWKKEKSRREVLKLKINQMSKELEIESITNSFPGVNPYWIAQFRDQQTTFKVENFLKQNKIETRRWWSFGCHKMPAFSAISAGKEFPNTNKVAETSLGLPLFIDMTNQQIIKIQNSIRLILESSIS